MKLIKLGLILEDPKNVGYHNITRHGIFEGIDLTPLLRKYRVKTKLITFEVWHINKTQLRKQTLGLGQVTMIKDITDKDK